LWGMAALLSGEHNGDSSAAQLSEQSRMDAQSWLRHYLAAYFVPIPHCFYAYDLVIMPHGENIILVLRNGVVDRVHYKDVAEETAVLNNTTPLPDDVARIRAEVPENMKVLSIFTDVVDCYLRFLSAALDESGTLDERTFWTTVAECITDYQQCAPQLSHR